LNTKKVIRYTNGDFNSIKNALVEHAKRYYPDSYKDFNEASFGSLVTDMVAYVGDMLSFYLDYNANEGFIDSALEYQNILRHGRTMGYRYKGSPSSYGTATFYIIAPAKASGYGPDISYLPILTKGSQFSTDSGKNFLLNENVDFANSSNEIVVSSTDSTTGIPSKYAVKALGQVVSGEYYSQAIVVEDYERFLRLKLGGDNISEVISVASSEGEIWYEVSYLSQDIIFKEVANRNSDKDSVPFILKPFVVPRRFVVEQELGATYLQFGYGSEEEIKTTNVADASNVVLQLPGKDYVSDDSFDPSKLLSTEKFGIAPSNTTLTIVTRNNSSENVNVAVGGLSKIVEPVFDFDNITSLNSQVISEVMESLEVTNEEPVVGSVSLQSTEEIRRRALDSYASQERAVTGPDYKSVIYSMPSKFGAIKRCNVVQDSDSLKRALNVYVLSENESGVLCASNDTLKQNLKTWLSRYKMINDYVKILDGRIINIGLECELLADDGANKFTVLNSAVTYLSDYFSVLPEMGQSFSVTQVYSALKAVNGIVDVINVKIVQKKGGAYSDIRFDIDSFLSDDGRNVFCPKNCVLEIKYPKSDILCTVK
jgi:hypothetical protein